MFVLRDDLIHPIISGNKLRKLKYNVLAANKNECQRIVTFGGAYSNHILATAFLCVEFSIPLTVMVRGDELNENYVRRLKPMWESERMDFAFERRKHLLHCYYSF